MKNLAFALWLVLFSVPAFAASNDICLPNQCWAVPLVTSEGEYMGCVSCDGGHEPNIDSPKEITELGCETYCDEYPHHPDFPVHPWESDFTTMNLPFTGTLSDFDSLEQDSNDVPLNGGRPF